MATSTLSDVAQAAGVSYATADRVINKRGNVADKSIAKVNEAVAALGYVRNIAAANLSRGRVYRLAFLIPQGANAFFGRIRQHIKDMAHHLKSEKVYIDVIEVEAFSVDRLQASIASLIDQDFDGVAIVGLQSAELSDPLEQLRAKGVAVVGLVSDLPSDVRAAYIGIDNRAAGRTAGRMVGMAHADKKGCVQAFVGSMDARDHAERFSGFCEVIEADFPKIKVLDPIITNDDAVVLKDRTQFILSDLPEMSALYNVGAGNIGLIAALRAAPSRRPFCVVHELVVHSRKALIDRHIDLVIDQRPDVEINRALTVLRALIDDKDLPNLPDLVPTIYVQDNLPSDTSTDLMKAQDT